MSGYKYGAPYHDAAPGSDSITIGEFLKLLNAEESNAVTSALRSHRFPKNCGLSEAFGSLPEDVFMSVLKACSPERQEMVIQAMRRQQRNGIWHAIDNAVKLAEVKESRHRGHITATHSGTDGLPAAKPAIINSGESLELTFTPSGVKFLPESLLIEALSSGLGLTVDVRDHRSYWGGPVPVEVYSKGAPFEWGLLTPGDLVRIVIRNENPPEYSPVRVRAVLFGPWRDL